MDDDTRARLERLERLSNVLAAMVLDDTVLMGTVLPKCGTPGCHNLATVKHVFIDLIEPGSNSSCDACAARLIVTAARAVAGGAATKAASSVVVASLAREDYWVDLPHAKRVRQVQAIIDVDTSDAQETLQQRH